MTNQHTPIGPTPQSPAEIAEHIYLEGEQLLYRSEDLERLADVAARAEHRYKVAFAQARTRAVAKAEADKIKVTVSQAEDIATIETGDERLEFLLTMQHLMAAREGLKARIQVLNSLQTLAGIAQRAAG